MEDRHFRVDADDGLSDEVSRFSMDYMYLTESHDIVSKIDEKGLANRPILVCHDSLTGAVFGHLSTGYE